MEAITTNETVGEPTAAAPITVDLLHDLWPKILLDVAIQDRRVRALLEQCRPGSVKGSEITLVTAYPLHHRKLSEQAQRGLLEGVIARLVNRSVSIGIELVASKDATSRNHVVEAAKQIFDEALPVLFDTDWMSRYWKQVVSNADHLQPGTGECLAKVKSASWFADRNSLVLLTSDYETFDLFTEPENRWAVEAAIYAIVGLLVHVGIEHYQVDFRTMPYPDYLKTEHWQKTAAAAKERAGQKCQVCNKYGQLHTHHRTYERRGAELPEDLIVLCAGCHSLFHKSGKLARQK